jgi:hypothetical protein
VEQQSSTVKASSQLGRSALASSWLVVRNRSGTGSATKERCSACAGGAPTAARTVVIVSVRTMHPQPQVNSKYSILLYANRKLRWISLRKQVNLAQRTKIHV